MNLREIQLYKLDILEDIASICEKHGIRYVLHYGTLLGAIRHQGFIPWDDDVDIAVPWEDYKKLTDVINREYSDRYFAQNHWTDCRFPLLWTQIRVNGTTSMPVEYCSYDIHWGMCIDVFALVSEENDEKKRQKQIEAFGMVNALLSTEFRAMTNVKSRGRREKLIDRIPRGVRYLIVDAILKRYANNPRENGRVFTMPLPEITYGYSDILHTEKRPFEGKLFSVPVGYDSVLTVEYGDYMTPPPEKERGGHESALGEIINDIHKDYQEYREELSKRC